MKYIYFCTKCKLEIVTDIPGFIVCAFCDSGDDIVDYHDFGDYDNKVMGDGSFNWNKS